MQWNRSMAHWGVQVTQQAVTNALERKAVIPDVVMQVFVDMNASYRRIFLSYNKLIPVMPSMKRYRHWFYHSIAVCNITFVPILSRTYPWPYINWSRRCIGVLQRVTVSYHQQAWYQRIYTFYLKLPFDSGVSKNTFLS